MTTELDGLAPGCPGPLGGPLVEGLEDHPFQALRVGRNRDRYPGGLVHPVEVPPVGEVPSWVQCHQSAPMGPPSPDRPAGFHVPGTGPGPQAWGEEFGHLRGLHHEPAQGGEGVFLPYVPWRTGPLWHQGRPSLPGHRPAPALRRQTTRGDIPWGIVPAWREGSIRPPRSDSVKSAMESPTHSTCRLGPKMSARRGTDSFTPYSVHRSSLGGKGVEGVG